MNSPGSPSLVTLVTKEVNSVESRVQQAELLLEQERQRTKHLAEQLRSLGINPDEK